MCHVDAKDARVGPNNGLLLEQRNSMTGPELMGRLYRRTNVTERQATRVPIARRGELVEAKAEVGTARG